MLLCSLFPKERSIYVLLDAKTGLFEVMIRRTTIIYVDIVIIVNKVSIARKKGLGSYGLETPHSNRPGELGANPQTPWNMDAKSGVSSG